MRKDEFGLTPNQRAFCDEYLRNGHNGTQAYKKAYPKVKKDVSAANSATKLLRTTYVEKYIAMRLAENKYEAKVEVKRVLQEEQCLAYSDLTTIMEMEGKKLGELRSLPEHFRRAISQIDLDTIVDKEGNVQQYIKKIKLYDKGKSLDRLEKHLGMFEKDNAQKVPDVIGKIVESVLNNNANKPLVPIETGGG